MTHLEKLQALQELAEVAREKRAERTRRVGYYLRMADRFTAAALRARAAGRRFRHTEQMFWGEARMYLALAQEATR